MCVCVCVCVCVVWFVYLFERLNFSERSGNGNMKLGTIDHLHKAIVT